MIFVAFVVPEKTSSRSSLIEYSIEDQRIIYNTLTKEERDEIWIDRLTKEANLNKGAKKRVLLKMAKELVVDNYDPKEDEAVVIKLFGREEAKRILTTLLLPSESPLPSKFLNEKASIKSNVVDGCGSCSTSSDWCTHINDHCVDAGCHSYWNYGCGTLFMYACNGECVYKAPESY